MIILDWFIEMMLDGINWTDVTDDVIGMISVKYGIFGNGPLDRVANTGQMKFTLNNSATNSGKKIGYYSPEHSNCRTGFQSGIRVRLKFVYEGMVCVKFHGIIPANGINVIPGIYKERKVEVLVVDWMEQASIHQIYLPTLETSKRMNEIIPLIIANMPIEPLATEYNLCESVFETAFDTVRNKTTSISEMAKLALSELGYIYIKRDKVYGETIVTDGRFKRSNMNNLTQVPLRFTYLACENGDYLVQEDGYYLLYDGEYCDAVINKTIGDNVRNPWIDLQTSYGKNLFNDIRYTAYPTYVDVLPTTILFSLNTTIEIASGDTRYNLLGRYRDPTSGAASVSGKDMVTPVATIDYLFNTIADGSGTDITSYLEVTAHYGTEGVNYTLKNNHPSLSGFITKLQARGRGIYVYDPITLMIEDTASKAIHGTRILNLDLKYERNIETADAFANLHLGIYKNPKMAVETVKFLINYDIYSLLTFLECDIGSKFYLYDELTGIDGNYFINGIEFDIMPGGIIFATWYPCSAANDIFHFWYLGVVGSSELGSTTILGF